MTHTNLKRRVVGAQPLRGVKGVSPGNTFFIFASSSQSEVEAKVPITFLYHRGQSVVVALLSATT